MADQRGQRALAQRARSITRRAIKELPGLRIRIMLARSPTERQNAVPHTGKAVAGPGPICAGG